MGKKKKTKIEAVKAVIADLQSRMEEDGEYAKTYCSTVVIELSRALGSSYYLSAADFATVPSGDLLYVGSLSAAKAYVKRTGDYDAEATKLSTGLWEVTLLNGDNWGRGDTPELAWRYVFGAYFGPIDEGFTPQFI